MRKTMRNTTVTLLLLTLSISTVFLVYLHFFASNDRNLSGEWTAELDMGDRAAVTATGWLQGIEAVSVSLEDVEAHMQGMTIQVNLTMEQTGSSQGTFRCNVSQESYDACSRAAYEAFAVVFRELLAERLHMAGYAGSTDQDAVEALVVESFGMPTVSYLMSYGPALLPALEELQAQYEGSGVYETGEGILTRYYDGQGTNATRMERYIRKDSSLILAEEAEPALPGVFSEDYPVIFTLTEMQ